MATTWKTVVVMFISLVALVSVFQYRDRQLRPLEMRAKAAQWVLTTGWMEERFKERQGRYVACGGRLKPCWQVLGWMNMPRNLEGYVLEVHLVAGGYRIEASGGLGRWVLETGGSIRWEGEAVSATRPPWW